MDADLFLQQFGHLAQGEGGIKKLRDVILQLAVQGKLIAQSQADEPAQTLLRKINPKATKIDGLYEIPSNWVWTKLEAVSTYIQRGKGPTYSDIKQVPVVSQKCVQWRGFDFALARFIDPETLQNYQEERFLIEGDLLWNSTGTGTLGRVCIYPGSELYSKVVADSHVTIVRLNSMEPRYVWCFLASPIVQMNIEASGSTNQIELSTSTVKNHPVPIPPFAEQKRIVAKVDELMTLCDKLEAEQKAQRTLKTQAVQSTLHHLTSAESPASFDTSLNILERTFGNWFDDLTTVKHLRATILQLAVQGKLIPQNPTDEPASELLKRIDAEKKRLMKEGKIGREKTPAPMSEDNQPYSLPEKWEWVRLGAISASIQYGYTASADSTKQEPKFVRITDIHNSRVNWETVPGCDIEPDKLPTYQLAENDFLIARTGGTIGKSFLVTNVDFDSVFASYLIRIRTFPSFVSPQFLKCYLDSPLYWEQLYAASMGTGQPNVNGTSLGMLKTPLPPLAEQKRIVAKVDELMTICDQLEAHITHTQTLNTHLMDSLIHRMTEAA
jgi:type I restriction enzyme S subunit